MTVVLEDQVKTITAEISEQFGSARSWNPGRFASCADIEDVVRSVIAQYDISGIARLDFEPSDLAAAALEDGPR